MIMRHVISRFRCVRLEFERPRVGAKREDEPRREGMGGADEIAQIERLRYALRADAEIAARWLALTVVLRHFSDMKAILCKTLDGPESLTFDDIPVPEPQSGEALIRVKAVALN